MQKFQFTQYAKLSGAFVATATVGTELLLLGTDNLRLADIGPEYYTNAPLLIVGFACVPASIHLFERLLTTAHQKPRQIETVERSAITAQRAIPFTKNGKPGTLLANTTRFILGDESQQEGRNEGRVCWRVPVQTPQGENIFTVHESSLRDFLEIAHRRRSHQFSRRYWTRKRRPPMLRPQYDAFMRLLVEAGLIEGRHPDGRASGTLVMFPREALMFLRHESRFAVA